MCNGQGIASVNAVRAGQAVEAEGTHGSNNEAQASSKFVEAANNLKNISRPVWHRMSEEMGSDNTHKGSTWLKPSSKSAVTRFSEASEAVKGHALHIASGIEGKDTNKINTLVNHLVDLDLTLPASDGDNPQTSTTQQESNRQAAKNLLRAVLTRAPGDARSSSLFDNCLLAHLTNARMSDYDESIPDPKYQQMHCRSTLSKELEVYQNKLKPVAKAMGQNMGPIRDGLLLNRAISTAVRNQLVKDRSSLVEQLNEFIQEVNDPQFEQETDRVTIAERTVEKIAAQGRLLALAATPKELRDNQALFSNLLKLSTTSDKHKNIINGGTLAKNLTHEDLGISRQAKSELIEQLNGLKNFLDAFEPETSNADWAVERTMKRPLMEQARKQAIVGPLIKTALLAGKVLKTLGRAISLEPLTGKSDYEQRLSASPRTSRGGNATLFHPLPKSDVTPHLEGITGNDADSHNSAQVGTPSPQVATTDWADRSGEIQALKNQVQELIRKYGELNNVLEQKLATQKANLSSKEESLKILESNENLKQGGLARPHVDFVRKVKEDIESERAVESDISKELEGIRRAIQIFPEFLKEGEITPSNIDEIQHEFNVADEKCTSSLRKYESSSPDTQGNNGSPERQGTNPI